MITKEKAKLLIYDFWNITGNFHLSKQCALIAVDEILKEIEDIDDGQTVIPYDYWKKVKQEIEKL